MRKLSINLSPRHRLEFKIVKQRRGVDVVEEPFLPSISKIRKARKGNKISRFFRHIFEHKKLNRVLGSNIAVMALASTLVPSSFTAQAQLPENTENEVRVLGEQVTFTTEPGVQYPVENVRLNQGYSVFHPGLDFDGVIGDPVRPIMSGVVEAVQYQNSNLSVEGISSLAYGNAVLIRHGDDLTSLYAHLSEINVTRNQEVSKKTVLGKVGSTGFSSGAHLHLEIRQNNYPIYPYAILR